MDQQLHNFISSIEESHLLENEKKALVETLQKDGVTQNFADLFKKSLIREVQRRGETASVVVTNFDAQFARLLKEFEKEGTVLEKDTCERISLLDPLDTVSEQRALDIYTAALKNQRSVYEKKVRDLTVEFLKAIEKLP